MAHIKDGKVYDCTGREYVGDGLEELTQDEARTLTESLALEAVVSNDQEKMDMANCVAKQYGKKN